MNTQIGNMLPDDEISNYELFRDILATPLIEKCSSQDLPLKARQKRKSRRKSAASAIQNEKTPFSEESNDAEDLAEFIDYVALEIFTSLPHSLRTLTYTAYMNTPSLQNLYIPPFTPAVTSTLLQSLPPSATDSLTTYNLLPSTPNTFPTNAEEFLHPILAAFIDSLIKTPLPPSQTKSLHLDSGAGCEICSRDHVPLTYHHLIPRSVHEKVLRRKWHAKEDLASVAWLCRACHSFVHGLEGNEVLARELYTVELLLEREEVRRWGAWVGRVRWRKR